MSSVIEELCRGAEWSERDLRKDAAERNRIDLLYNYLKDNISPNQVNSLKKLMKSEYDLRQAENIRFFIGIGVLNKHALRRRWRKVRYAHSRLTARISPASLRLLFPKIPCGIFGSTIFSIE